MKAGAWQHSCLPKFTARGSRRRFDSVQNFQM